MICKLAYIPADCKSCRNATSRFTLSHSLAAAIAPRRQKKSARHQFSPLGKTRCVPRPITVDDNRWQFCNPPSRANPVAAHRMAYPLPRWKEKVHTFSGECPHRSFRQRLIEKVNCRTERCNSACSTDYRGGMRTATREACPPSSSREPQCRIRRHTSRLQCSFTFKLPPASRKAPSIAG